MAANSVLNVARTAGVVAVGIVVVSAAMVLAPVVSLIAVPIFAVKSLIKWIDHSKAFKATLGTDQTRASFGRIKGQDYTKWDGKEIVAQVKLEPSKADLMHAAVGKYMHGSQDRTFEEDVYDGGSIETPFDSQEDMAWLKKEITRREKEELLDTDFKVLRASMKLLIPVVGFIWVAFSETAPGGASTLGCQTCMMSGLDTKSKAKHWGWHSAISYHEKNYSNRVKSLTAMPAAV
jgi:hypothetical protein